MTKVKVCGLTRVEDAMMLGRHMPDYAGFVFAKSKRRLEPDQARAIAQCLDKRILRVGVFVDSSVDYVLSVVSTVGLDVVQLHADTTYAYFDQLKKELSRAALSHVKIWQRIPIPSDATSADEVFERINYYPELTAFDALLFDVCTASADGGSGQEFSWSVGRELINRLPDNIPGVIIAGGMNSNNVKKAYALFHPVAFDASSALETDGYKDEAKVAAFVNSIRQLKNEE